MKPVPRKIVYIQYTNPAGYPPLEHSSRILADSGWQVLFLGVLNAESQAKVIQFPPHPNIRVRHLQSPPRGIRQKLNFLFFGLWSLLWVLRFRPGYVYLSDSLTTPIGLFLHVVTRTPVIYHEHDSPEPDQSYRSRFEQFIGRSRKTLAQRAVLCILPNQARAQVFQRDTYTAVPVLTVWNCPARAEVTPPRIIPASYTTPLTLWYHGSLNEFRLPFSMVRAIATLPYPINLRFAGYETAGNRGYLERMMQLAHAENIHEQVQYLGTRQREEIIRLGSQCDVGIGFAFQGHSINTSDAYLTGATNKTFDYMASGLALLVTDSPAFTQMFVTPGYGLACNPDSVDSIAQALKWFYDHRLETLRMGEAGRQRIAKDWNYETVFQPVLKFLSDREP